MGRGRASRKYCCGESTKFNAMSNSGSEEKTSLGKTRKNHREKSYKITKEESREAWGTETVQYAGQDESTKNPWMAYKNYLETTRDSENHDFSVIKIPSKGNPHKATWRIDLEKGTLTELKGWIGSEFCLMKKKPSFTNLTTGVAIVSIGHNVKGRQYPEDSSPSTTVELVFTDGNVKSAVVLEHEVNALVYCLCCKRFPPMDACAEDEVELCNVSQTGGLLTLHPDHLEVVSATLHALSEPSPLSIANLALSPDALHTGLPLLVSSNKIEIPSTGFEDGTVVCMQTNLSQYPVVFRPGARDT